MVAITATNSATLSLQASLTRSRLDQARREAAQAEANAEALRAQAQEQDQVAEKAHSRERTLNASASGSAANTASPPSAPVSSTPKVAGQPGASYVETLHTVLEGSKSLAQADYTLTVQKNLVISSLFQKANQVWQATPPDVRVARLYGAGRSANVSADTDKRVHTTA